MKDHADGQAIELFEQLPAKRRGRPVTGTAKTAAQRQADYRNRKRWRGGSSNNGHKHVDFWLDFGRWLELDYLASYHGKTTLEMLEHLIGQANEQLTSAMTQAEYLEYVDKKLYVTEKE